MHHSPNPDPEMQRRMRDQFGLGPTGKYPEGKLTNEDEGEIKIAIGSSGGKVIIDFGKPTAWIGFSPAQARQIAESIRQQSYKAEGK